MTRAHAPARSSAANLDVLLVNSTLGARGGVTVDVDNIARGLVQRGHRARTVTGLRPLVAQLRANVLLDGYRGAPPGDREALLALLLRVSALVESLPELQEFDLNPVKVLTPGDGVIAIDGRMRLAPLG